MSSNAGTTPARLMRGSKILHNVTGCQNCPFAVRGRAICGLSKPPVMIEAALVIGDETTAPDQCPIRNSTHAFKLLQEKPAAKRGPGRPLPASSAGRDLLAEGAHFRAWLAKNSNCGLWKTHAELCEATIYGPALKIHHFRAALSGRRPFHEPELDKVVAYATAEMNYPGFTPIS